MELLVANLSGRVRREERNGRRYLVAPLVLIVPGVLNGSMGPLYYPAEEVSRSTDSWNGIPLVENHPTLNGRPVSARDPDVLARTQLGFVFRANADPRLRAEGWFDIEDTRRVNPAILRSLESAQPMELSTGLFTENELAQNGSHHNGTPYHYIARNYRPDHLAILPSSVGACSIKDGCGVLVNQQTPTDSGDPSMGKLNDTQRKELIANLTTNCKCQDRPPFKGLSPEALNAKSDEELMTLDECRKALEEPAHNQAVPESFTDPYGNKHVFNREARSWSLVANASQDSGKQANLGINPTPNLATNTPPPATPKPKSFTEALQQYGTPEEQAIWQSAMAVHNERRTSVITRLMEHVIDENTRQVIFNQLKDRKLEELETMLALVPPRQPQLTPPPIANYFGGLGAPAQAQSGMDEEPLKLPVYNFGRNRN